ncbi:hypothetical protein TNCV_4380811 [Trichonephila clavipes]|nr:hypothetical protein TNCV_4380811 [Trichonephila clavipes]
MYFLPAKGRIVFGNSLDYPYTLFSTRDDQKNLLQVSGFENYILWRNFVSPKWRQMLLLVIQLVRKQTGCQSRNMTERGQPSSSTTEIAMARIGEMMQNNRRVTLREISSELRLSYGSVQHIDSDALRYSKTVM